MTVPAGEGAPDGWFVFYRQVTADAAGGYVVDREITEADLVWMVGPDGWSGCPAGISCLHYGLQMLGFEAATGRYHHQRRVTTGSDDQRSGTFSYAGGIVTAVIEQQFSCAHPHGGSYAVEDASVSFSARVADDGNLWLQDWDGASGATYWVYRPVTESDAHNRYNLAYCADAATCHCLCSSRDFLADYTCY
jgi:hypothetical protein